MKAPYRTAAEPFLPTPPIPPPRWKRVLAAMVPQALGGYFPAYRRTLGGRWSQLSDEDGDNVRWVRTPQCRGPVLSRMFQGEPVPVGACSDPRVLNLMHDEECGVFEHTEHNCNCEVWPEWEPSK